MATPDGDKLRLYEAIRDYVKHEDGLIKERLTWVLSIHGFLYATYGFTLQKKLEVAQKIASDLFIKKCADANFSKILPDSIGYYRIDELGLVNIQVDLFLILIALVGFLITLQGIRSLAAARNALTSLRTITNGTEAFPGCLPEVPLSLGAGERSYVINLGKDGGGAVYVPSIAGGGDSNNIEKGFSASRFIPIILSLSWIFSLFYSIYIIVNSENYSNNTKSSIPILITVIIAYGLIWAFQEPLRRSQRRRSSN